MAHAAPTPAQSESSLGPSIVRTLTPLVVGLLVALAARWVGVELPEEALTEVVTVLVAGLYYAAVRVLEEHVSPVFGRVLLGLGLGGQPRYE